MGWKTKVTLGPRNLFGKTEREAALESAAYTLNMLGIGQEIIDLHLSQQRDRLFSFPEFTQECGKKLKFVLQVNPDEGYRLSIQPNRRWTRNEIRETTKGLINHDGGHVEIGTINRFRRS